MKQETKIELCRIKGMLSNPLRTIRLNTENMLKQVDEGKPTAYICGMYKGMTEQVLYDIQAISEYIDSILKD